MRPDVTSGELQNAAKQVFTLALLTFSKDVRERLLARAEELLADAESIDRRSMV